MNALKIKGVISLNNTDNNSNAMFFFILGCLSGVVMCITLIPEAWIFVAVTAGILALAAIALTVQCILSNFTIPYVNRKKAALRALGKEGVKIMRHDETAKLAYKGIYAVFLGKYPKAEEMLQQALANSDVRQNQMFCVEWLIRLYEAMDNAPKLLWCYRKAVEYSPDNPEAQSRLGHAYFSDGKLDQAYYCFEQALRYDPNNGYSYYSIAKIHMVRGEDEKAFETLTKLLKINENHPLVHSELANYYAMQNNREMAEEECKKAQLCGIKEPDELNRRINAILSFNSTEFGGGDLPSMYYRRIEKPEEKIKGI